MKFMLSSVKQVNFKKNVTVFFKIQFFRDFVTKIRNWVKENTSNFKNSRYGHVVAILSTSAIMAINVLFRKHLGDDSIYLLFFIPIMLSTWFGGFASGIFCAAIATMSIYLFFQTKLYAPYSSQNLVRLSAFFMEGIFISGLAITINTKAATQKIKKREQLFQALTENSLDGVAILDREGSIIYCSPACKKIMGYDIESVIGLNGFKFVHPADYELMTREFKDLLNNPDKKSGIECRVAHKDGTWRWVESHTSNLLDDPDVGGVVVNFRDITEQNFNEHLLDRSLKQLQVILQGVTDGITAQDAGGKLIYANTAAAKLCGYFSVEEMHLRTAEQIASDFEMTDEFGNTIASNHLPHITALRGESSEPIIMRFKNKKTQMEKWSIVKSSPVFDQKGNVVMAVNIFRDITQNRNAEHVLRYQALHDILTGLGNRKAFIQKLNAGINSSRQKGLSAAVMLLDLDRFKNVNDALGHDIGDLLLKEVAKKIQKKTSDPDMVARLGGDEFMILINNVSSFKTIEKISYDVLQQFSKDIKIRGYTLAVNVSIGIAMYPNDGRDSTTLFKNADIALHRAKEAGGNQFKLYSGTMNLKGAEKLQLEGKLKFAARKNELRLCFEPILNIADSSLTAVESLVRWKHPTLGLLFPSDFIEMAEETGSILSIDNWVMKNVAKSITELGKSSGNVPKFTVNVSARQFSQLNMVGRISKIVYESGINPKFLALEITERTAMSDKEMTISKLKQLKQMGIQIIIDDFGTGYSSLTYLKSFPIDKIKIDQLFVKNCTIDDHDAAIIKAIISIAHSLNLEVIAEGVEAQDQLSFLKNLGCDHIQGFLISKPVTKDQFYNWLQKAKYKISAIA